MGPFLLRQGRPIKPFTTTTFQGPFQRSGFSKKELRGLDQGRQSIVAPAIGPELRQKAQQRLGPDICTTTADA